MTLEEKKNLYREKFPKILAERMVEQMDAFKVSANNTRDILIDGFKLWKRTKEGAQFWSDIQKLYRLGIPTTDQILEVFRKHNIQKT